MRQSLSDPLEARNLFLVQSSVCIRTQPHSWEGGRANLFEAGGTLLTLKGFATTPSLPTLVVFSGLDFTELAEEGLVTQADALDDEGELLE